jgi:hypothetical protein
MLSLLVKSIIIDGEIVVSDEGSNNPTGRWQWQRAEPAVLAGKRDPPEAERSSSDVGELGAPTRYGWFRTWTWLGVDVSPSRYD